MLSFDTQGGLLTITFSGELYLSRRIDVPLSTFENADTDQKNTQFERVALELQRSLDHFDRQYHFAPVAKLILAPLGNLSAELQAYLAANLYIPAELLTLDMAIDVARIEELGSAQAQQAYYMTIGAALRHEEKEL
jgi:MSHA biogenesis protein MshI